MSETPPTHPTPLSNRSGHPGGSTTPRRRWLRGLLLPVILALVAMWVYAFVFAPRGGINPVRDKAWTDGARAACTDASAQLQKLVFRTRITESNKATELPRFVANLDQASIVLDTMLDRIDALPRTSERAQRLVPQWMADYRAFYGDIDAWVAELRTGNLAKFGVTITDTGIPVNERINTFATENRIKVCMTNLITTDAETD